MSRLIWIRLVLLLATLAFLVGCGREFDPYYRANKFRLLGVKSSEPLLEPGETAELTAATWAPDGDEVTYQWEWCPFRTSAGNGFECPVTQEELQQQLTEGSDLPPGFMLPLEDFDLGSEPTAELPYPAPQPIIIAFCEALQEQLADAPDDLAGLIPVVDCARGFDISVRLIVESGDSRIVAGKRISLSVPDVQPNDNPDVVEIQIRPQEDEDPQDLRDAGLEWVPDGDDWYTMPEGEVTPLLGEYQYELRSIVDPESVEIWQPAAPAGDDREFLDPESEVIVFRWFISDGSLLEDSNAIFVDGVNELEEAGDTIWLPNCDDGGSTCTGRVWSVVRDGRLGLDWVERDIEIVGDAP